MNNQFTTVFNQIFNKIPHIYSELFLNIFNNNYNYFIDYNLDNNLNIFINILEKSFYNLNNLNKKAFYYHSITNILNTNNLNYYHSIINYLSIELSSNIEDNYLLDIIDKNPKITNYFIISIQDKEIEELLIKISVYHLIAKVLVKTVKLLNYYKSIKDSKLKKDIHATVDKYCNIDLYLDYVIENYKYNNLISKTNYKILIYLLCLSRNGANLEKEYLKEITKLLDSIGYNTSMHKIIKYHRTNYHLKPYIYNNITKLLNILFYKHYDNYNFIFNKEKILKTSFYLYIKNIDIKDKIILSITYPLWKAEWDSIKELYLGC